MILDHLTTDCADGGWPMADGRWSMVDGQHEIFTVDNVDVHNKHSYYYPWRHHLSRTQGKTNAAKYLQNKGTRDYTTQTTMNDLI